MEFSKSQKEIFSINKDPEMQKKRQNRMILKESINDPSLSEKSPIQENIKKKQKPLDDNNKNNINNNFIKIKVVLNYAYQKEYFEFLLPAKKIFNKNSQKYQFCLNDIIDCIRTYVNNKTIFLNENYLISYYINNDNENNIITNNKNNNENSIANKTYFCLGAYPLSKIQNYYLDIPSDGTLYLKFRKIISKELNLRYDIFEQENEIETDEKKKKDAVLKYNTNSKRANEKRIDYIIRKVFEWKELRKLTDNKMSLIEAAQIVGLSKKTLDEYYNQIRDGKKYGFDFNRFKLYKVNILRGFVKKKKGGEKNLNITNGLITDVKNIINTNNNGQKQDNKIQNKDNNMKTGKKRRRTK